jgi:histidinol-phosphate phosphatase family protein
LPAGRRPTDWERNVRGLEDARWATADMAYRRAALAAVGGFDERFPRAYREDADLGLRLTRDGWRIANGRRVVEHPVGPARATASLRLQAGNRDDALMSALHGGRWRERAGAAPGRRRRHLAIAASASATLALAAARRPRPAAFAAAAWLGGTAELAWARIAPGPRTPREVALMTATSVAMPPVATGHWLVGLARRRRLVRDAARAPDAVLLDRDGTLVVDVPYNGDPEQVRPMPGARAALDRLRAAGIPLAVISNQSGVGRGILTDKEVRAVNRRVEQLLGPLGPWLVCPHAPKDACDCRKPAPGLVTRAALLLGVEPERCAVVGDIGSDLDAARAAGARGVLVPTPATRRDEVLSAAETARDLPSAVELLIGAGS